jgi:hypothetical protein
MADIDKNPATLLAEQAALDPPQRRDVAAALRNVAETRPNMLGVMSSESEMPTMSAERAAARRARGSQRASRPKFMGWPL